MADETQLAEQNLFVQQQPDAAKAADAFAISRKLGLNPTLVYQNYDDYKAQAAQQERSAVVQANPSVARFVSQSPVNAALAAPQLPQLADHDAQLQTINPADSYIPGLSEITTGLTADALNWQALQMAYAKQAGVDGAAEREKEIFAKQQKLQHFTGFGGFLQGAGMFAGGLVRQVAGAVGGAAVGAIGTAYTGPGAIVGAGVGAGIGFGTEATYEAVGQHLADLDRAEYESGKEFSGISRLTSTLLVGSLNAALFGYGSKVVGQGAKTLSSVVTGEVTKTLASRPGMLQLLDHFGAEVLKGAGIGGAMNGAMATIGALGDEAARQVSGNFETFLGNPEHRAQVLSNISEQLYSGMLTFATLHGVGVGVHSVLDTVAGNRAKLMADGTDALVKQSKDLDPELVQQFGQMKDSAEPVKLPIQKVEELYVDHGKMVGDPEGPLGFIQDLKEQVANSHDGTVEIPLSQYIAQVDPGIHSAISKDLIHGSDGISLNELADLEKLQKLQPQAEEPKANEPRQNVIQETPKADERVAETQPKLGMGLDAELPAERPDAAGTNAEAGDESAAKAQKLSAAAQAVKDAGLEQNVTVFANPRSDERIPDEVRAKQALAIKIKSMWLDRFFENPKALGMLRENYNLWSRTLVKTEDSRREAATKIAETVGAKRETAAWKKEREGYREAVEAEVNGRRPNVIADTLLAKDGPKIRTDEVEKAYPLPLKLEGTNESIYAADLLRPILSDEGMHKYDLAEQFGLGSGKAMLDQLVLDELLRRRDGQTYGQYRKAQIERALDQKMEHIHGEDLQGLIDDMVSKAALSEPMMILVDAEMRALANAAGVKGVISRAELLAQTKKQFGQMNLEKALVLKDHERAISRAGRAAEAALLKGDFQQAFWFKQQQQVAMMRRQVAAEVRQDVKKFSRLSERYSDKPMPAGVDFTYASQIQRVLVDLGFAEPNDSGRGGMARSVDDIKAMTDPLSATAFAARVQNETYQNVMASPLLDHLRQRPMGLENLTVDEFRDVANSLISMDKAGREVNMVDSINGKVELSNVLEQLKGAFGKLDSALGTTLPILTLLRKVDAALRAEEQIAIRVDKSDPTGPYNTYIYRPIQEASVKENGIRAEMGKDIAKLRDGANLREVLDNPKLMDNEPTILGKPARPLKLTRENLRAIMLNMGNVENKEKLLAGRGWAEADVLDFIQTHATPADTAFVNKVHQIFDKWWPEMQALHRRTAGFAPDKTEALPSAFSDGGHYPLFKDPDSPYNGKPLSSDSPFNDPYYAPSTAKSHLMERTGAVYPVWLSLDGLHIGLGRMARDLAFREPLTEVMKVIGTTEFRALMKEHWGPEYLNRLDSWLHDVVGQTDVDTRSVEAVAGVMRYMNQGFSLAYLAGSLTTLAKHTLGATTSSVGEMLTGKDPLWSLGTFVNETSVIAKDWTQQAIPGLRSPQAMLTRWQQVMQKSEYMANRSHNLTEAIYDNFRQSGLDVDKGKVDFYRTKMIEFTGAAYSRLDLASAVPTWLVGYKRALRAGLSEEEAIYAGDQLVRNAHGDMSMVNKPPLLRLTKGVSAKGEALKNFTAVYGFFNHMYNRDVAAISRAYDALHGINVSDNAISVMAHLLVYGLVMGAIKTIGTPSDPERSWAHYAEQLLIHRISAPVPFLRDIGTAIEKKNPADIADNTPIGAYYKSVLTPAVKAMNKHADKITVRDAVSAIGTATLIPGTNQIAKDSQFLYDLYNNRARAQSATDFMAQMIFGERKERRR